MTLAIHLHSRRFPAIRRAFMAFVLALCISSLATATATATASTSTPQQDYEMALEAQTHRHYGEMMNLLRRAAQRGYVPAQELLAIALLQGEGLFGSQVPQDTCESLRWFRQAATQGSFIGQTFQDLLNRQRRHDSGARC